MPKKIGIFDGKLNTCPSSPNCVCSFEDPGDREHYVEPISYDGTATEAVQQFARIIHKHRRTQIKQQTDTYLHATFTSAIFRWTDDLEILVDENEKKIHLRSASRVGYDDLGVNRKRIESLIEGWRKAQAALAQ